MVIAVAVISAFVWFRIAPRYHCIALGWANHVQQQQSDATKHSNRATEPVYHVGPLRTCRDGTGRMGQREL